MTDDLSGRTAFADALARLRTSRGLNKKDLARMMGFDPSYVSHVENGRHRPTLEFASRADAVLRTGGELSAAFEEFLAETHTRPAHPSPRTTRTVVQMSRGLVVRREEAALTLGDDGYYRIRILRDVHNAGDQPVTRFPVRIEVDAHPADPTLSRDFYRDNPITLAELDFHATFDGEPARWELVKDCDAYKKIYVFFEPGGLPAPIYPGRSATIVCAYRVHATKWGNWFEREIRWPTEQLSVQLRFPDSMGVRLTGREVTWSGDRTLPTELTAATRDGMTNYSWSTSVPPLTNQYRFDWKVA
ncbi:multiprotein-bridging factor 1 family protein [Paractinoplanes rhizophilus]|uniref:Multiprotein-bridging factor 1 family protein n=1 Tax=Paractinoplanes rhizophilus TaxID=1416877 RepID=A0ABW2I3U0_9ACTN